MLCKLRLLYQVWCVCGGSKPTTLGLCMARHFMEQPGEKKRSDFYTYGKGIPGIVSKKAELSDLVPKVDKLCWLPSVVVVTRHCTIGVLLPLRESLSSQVVEQSSLLWVSASLCVMNMATSASAVTVVAQNPVALHSMKALCRQPKATGNNSTMLDWNWRWSQRA